MKIWDNGVIREMTAEEIKQDKEVDDTMRKLIPEKDDKAIMEEFIDRLSEANSLAEVKQIAKDIKEKIG